MRILFLIDADTMNVASVSILDEGGNPIDGATGMTPAEAAADERITMESTIEAQMV